MRILQMNIDNNGKGGAYVLIYNISKQISNIDKNVVFDYLTMDHFIATDSMSPGPESKLYEANLRKNRLIGHIELPSYVYKVLKENRYDIVHINSELTWKMLLYAVPAKRAGVKHILLHAHSTGIDGDHRVVKSICQSVARPFLPTVSNELLACSKEAAEYVFGKRFLKKCKCKILKNGIDTEKYSYSEDLRRNTRASLGINDDCCLIGNTSRIAYQKNSFYLAEIFYKYHETNKNSKLLYVGCGEANYKRQILDFIKDKGIDDSVIFLDELDSVEGILSALDVFVFPSRFEGLGISLIEAQSSGLPCIISTKVPKMAIITNNVKVLSVEMDTSVWADAISESYGIRDKNASQKVDKAGFNISSTARTLLDFYKSL